MNRNSCNASQRMPAFVSNLHLAKRKTHKNKGIDSKQLKVRTILATESQQQDETDIPKRHKLTLPVFPLRKAVKLPSESLTLNLYEERYLALAKYVLEGKQTIEARDDSLGNQRYFGALYCSDKPQIIRNASGPIVPMIEKGNVGVVCYVVNNTEGMVPTTAAEDEGDLRYRIKLQGLAIGRFSIDKVLHNGYGGGEACKTSGVEPLPFILVEASTINDTPVIPGSKEEDRLLNLELELFEKTQQEEDTDPEVYEKGGTNWEDPMDELALVLPTELQGKDKRQKNVAKVSDLQQVPPTQEVLKRWVSDQAHRREFFSFAAASTLLTEVPTKDVLQLLKIVATEERLDFIRQTIQGGSWLERLKSPFGDLLNG